MDNRNTSESSKLKQRVASMDKRFNTGMANLRFNGTDPLSILKFLAKCKFEANNNGISKEMTKLVLPYFFSGNAHIAYEFSLHLDAVDDFSVEIKS